jgi:hypothetical protein
LLDLRLLGEWTARASLSFIPPQEIALRTIAFLKLGSADMLEKHQGASKDGDA